MRLPCVTHTALFFLSGVVLYASGMREKSPIWNETWTDRLKQDLFVKYDKFARPMQHFNTTVVNFDITILYIDVDEFKSTVTITGWASHAWMDEKLKWDPAKYGDLQHIHVGNHEVWQPDVLLYHSGTASTIEHYGDTACIIFYDGKVLWVPPAQFVALCELNLHQWPFDTQICTLTFGSWTYHGEQIDMQLRNTTTEDLYVKNAEWKLVDLTKTRKVVKYGCCPDPYVNLNFQVTLKRNAWLYCSILLMPASAIVFLILVTFWLPPQSEMKISIAACTVLIISVFLAYFGFKVPLTTQPPMIVFFYSGSLCLVIISLVLSALVINITKRTHCKPLPRNIRMCLLSWPVGKLLGLSDLINVIESRRPITGQEMRGKLTEESTTISTSNISDDGDRQNMISPTKNITQLEWILAGTAIDRISFVVFSLALVLMGISFLR